MRRADGRLEQSAVPTGITVTKPAISPPLRDALELLFPLSVDCRELGIKNYILAEMSVFRTVNACLS